MAIGDGTGDIGWKKFLLAGWAFMECLFFGGLQYGWGSMNFVLKTEGIYADLCPLEATNSTNTTSSGSGTNDAVDVLRLITLGPNVTDNVSGNGTTGEFEQEQCAPQDEKMALCFTIASAMFCVGCAVLGLINMKFGTRVTRLIAFGLFLSGSLMMAFVSKDLPWLMYPGMSFLGIGGLALLLTNTQVAYLFVAGSSTFVGLLCGGFDMSSAVMLLVKIASENGFSRQNMFFIISGLHLLVLVSTFLFLPKMFISKREGRKPAPKINEDEDVGIELILNKDNATTDGGAVKDPSLAECVKRPLFFMHVGWFSIVQLRLFIFIGTLNQYLNRILDGDHSRVSYFTNVWSYTMMGGLVTSVLSGCVYDWQKLLCKGGKSQAYKDERPAVVPLATGSLLGLLLSVMVLLPYHDVVLYVTFVIMTVFRSFLYTMAVGLVNAVFPSSHFLFLYGIVVLFGGIFSFTQYALFLWMELYHEGFFHANIFLIILTSVSFIHPIYIWFRSSREERSLKSAD